MKNLDDLIESATALADDGLSKGEIADELNVSRETASWLVDRGGGGAAAADLDDVHVDWSAIGRSSTRLDAAGRALADLVSTSTEVDDLESGTALVIGVEKAGAPLATTVARALNADLGAYTPRKHRWEEGDMAGLSGSFSRNFAPVEGRRCVVVDDTVTSGTTLRETVGAVRDGGGTPVACGVLVDKRGTDEIDGVPVEALIRVIRVGE